jgi:7-cyano-7-deazaguanine synthase
MSGAIVMLSGGIDSAVALAWSLRERPRVFALSFQYYLRPFRERLSVYRLLEHYPAHLIEIPLPFLKETVDANPDESADLPEGYVPNRNMIFYSIAAHYAEIKKCDLLVGGHVKEDREDFPDASPDFFSSLQKLLDRTLLTGKVEIRLPLAQWSKIEVLQKALEWNVPLQHTWSCYSDAAVPCHHCVSCTERAHAFRALNATDPLEFTTKSQS